MICPYEIQIQIKKISPLGALCVSAVSPHALGQINPK